MRNWKKSASGKNSAADRSDSRLAERHAAPTLGVKAGWIMTTYKGGETVRAGFYWNQGRWAAEVVPAAGGTLPGAGDAAYRRIAWPALLVIAPVTGGAFAMFLPFIGLALLVQWAYHAVTGRPVSPRSAART
jgi:hypothetical protein